MANSYPVPGRGAWTQTGGLLPAKPGAGGRAGYYRLSARGETAIGSAFASGADGGHDAYVVYLGVKALQGQLNSITHADVEVDGWFGPDTAAALVSAQKALGVEADGIAGRATLRAVLAPLIHDMAVTNGVPMAILAGLLLNESALDPAAVGVNGEDHGLAQINLGAHPELALEDALDPGKALIFAAGDLRHTHDVWAGRTRADPWDIAIANHNSPKLAKAWAQTGIAPVVDGRAFQIQTYVQRVRTAW